MMLWSSGDELDDDTYSRTCYIYIFRCLSCCAFIVCCWYELWLMYSYDVIYVNRNIWCWVKFIYYLLYFIPLRGLDSDVDFCFLLFYLFFLNPNGSYFCTTWVGCCRMLLTQGVRICGLLQILTSYVY